MANNDKAQEEVKDAKKVDEHPAETGSCGCGCGMPVKK